MISRYLNSLIFCLLFAAFASMSMAVPNLVAESNPEEDTVRYDFNKIGRVMDPNLTPQERAKLGVTYIKEEIDQPTKPYIGYRWTN